MEFAAALLRLSDGATLRARQKLALALLVCLPVPVLAASGMAIPLPSVIYRVAVALAEQTQMVVAHLPGFAAVAEDAQAATPREGTIRLTLAETTAAAAPRQAPAAAHALPEVDRATPAAPAPAAANAFTAPAASDAAAEPAPTAEPAPETAPAATPPEGTAREPFAPPAAPTQTPPPARDETPPDTSITAAPRASTTSGDASFAFGSADSGASFECSLDGAPYARCTSPVSYTRLQEGAHAFAVRAIDAAGNADPTPARHAWSVQGPPDTAIDAAPARDTTSADATFAFSSVPAGAGFECSLDGAPFSACASPTTYGGLALGSHTFAVRATDARLVADPTPATYTWTIAAPPDTTAPATTILTAPDATTTDTNATFTFSSSERGSTFRCSLDDAAFVACTSPAAYSGLAVGVHSFEVRATDAAGNTDPTPASYVWSISAPPDTTAPETSLDAAPAATTTATGATFAFSSSEPGSTFECSLDGAAFAVCVGPADYTGLALGDHTFAVRATDAAGNTDATPATHAWTIYAPPDTTAPETTIDAAPASTTTSTSASFEFSGSEAGSTFECSLDGAAFASCADPAAYSGLATGDHTFAVRATDAAGNTDATPATHAWTISPPPAPADTAPPETRIDSGPTATTTSTGASLAFSSSEAGSTFECSLDGAPFTACTSPAAYTALALGDHTFAVRATDAGLNTDATPATHEWTIVPPPDTTPPETTLDAAPAASTTDTSATFAFSSDEAGATFECALDGAPFTACTSPVTYTGLALGDHAFAVRATDAAGNADGTPATHAWTVVAPPDTTAPETEIDAAPAASTSETTATFAFSATEAASTFECSLDGAAFAACTSGATYSGLALGDHTFAVRATDAAGNADATPATHAWTIVAAPDTTAPETTIDTAPAASTSETTATFAFSSDEPGSSFECSLDGAPFTACASETTYTGLALGDHTFAVRATDAGLNTDATPATHAWTIVAPPDTTAPETTIDSGPDETTSDDDATFAFSSSEPGSTFECSLDGATYTACTSPKTYNDLGDEAHTFSVRATDAAGNTDATPATHSWTVQETEGPQTHITTAPPAETTDTSATFEFTSSGNPARSYSCSPDGSAWAICTSPTTYTGLASGSHTFAVRATDNGGDSDTTPATHTWTVTAP